MAATKVQAYRQLLTPKLHRRFTGAAIVVLVLCYFEAILIGEKTSFFWSWFPIGLAGIKTLLLFVSALSVFVLRVAQLRIGARQTPSASSTISHYLLRFDVAQTLLWYLFAAWWFSEVYVWSAADSADLGWVSRGKSWERRRLNERPIYLRSVFILLAWLQGFIHIYYDYDSIPISTETPSKSGDKVEEKHSLIGYLRTTALKELKPLHGLFWYDRNQILVSLLRNVVLRTLGVSLVAPFLYGIFIRRTAWKWSLAFAELVWDVPPSKLSYIPPYYPSLMYRSMSAGLLLVILFEASNSVFTAYVGRPPVRKGQPFSDQSKDPNSSLSTGFKSRKLITKTFGLWELSYIGAQPSDRRKSLFTDIDRPTGSMWSQIHTACILVINDIQVRIIKYQNPTAPISNAIPAQKPAVIDSLPRISTPLRHDNILVKSPAPSTPAEKLESSIGAVAKSYGQSPNPGAPKLPSSTSPRARSFISNILPSTPERKLLTQGGDPSSRPQSSQSGLLGTLQSYMLTFLGSPIGAPFRHTFARRARSVVLGSPTSELYPLILSIRILSDLSVASLTEDPYGRVAKDIPQIIKTFVSTIQLVDDFVMKKLDVHRTDVYFQEGEGANSGREVPEIEFLVREMKLGLKNVIEKFGPFAEEFGVRKGEMDVARALVAGLDDKEKATAANKQNSSEKATAPAAANGKDKEKENRNKGVEMREIR